MIATARNVNEPPHILLLRGIVYLVTSWLLVQSLAAAPGLLAATAAVPLGFCAGAYLARRALYGVFQASGAALVLLAVAWLAEPILAGSGLLVSRLGVGTVLGMVEVVSVYCSVLAVTTVLRSLAGQRRLLILLEAAVVVLAFTLPLASHRDMQLDQPRFLTDWALSRNIDPRRPLLWVGVALSVAMVVLLLPRQSARRNLVALAVLLVLATLALNGLSRWGSELQSRLLAAAVQPDPPAPPSTLPPNPNADTPGPPPPSPQNPPPKPPGTPPLPLAVVTLHDDFTPAEKQFYFREKAFSVYSTGMLQECADTASDADVPREHPTQSQTVVGQAPLFAEATADMFADVETTVCLMADNGPPLALTNAIEVSPQVNPKPEVFRRAYHVKSHVLSSKLIDARLASCPGGNPMWSEAERAMYLAAPADARYRQLAEQIITDSLNNESLKPQYQNSSLLRALVIRRWIETNITYTKSPPDLNGPDAIERFLFESRQGYCTHIAHSTALLLRSLGIASRVAGGFSVDLQRVGQGSAILLQTTDAHAWCEIYLQGVGWVVVDASCEKSLDPPPPSPSPNLQQQLGDMARQNPPPQNEPQQQPAEDHPDDEAQASQVAKLALKMFLGILLLLALYGVKLYRMLCVRYGSIEKRSRICYRAILDRLAEIGITRQFGETREEFAVRVARLVPSFAELTSAHLGSAWGTPGTAAGSDWLAMIARCNRELAHASSTRRRWLGALNPLAWLKVR